VKAVNLIPSDSRRSSSTSPRALATPAFGVIAALLVALVLVVVYVLSSNTVSDRQAQVASLQGQVVQEQALAARLGNYSQFVKLAQARADTVRTIAQTRFNWHDALADLAKVVPANTSLQSLLGTVAPGVTVTGPGGSAGGGASTSALRGDIPVPAFELAGCTKTQDDVARLMSRLRVMPGVTRVTLADSVKSSLQGGASTGSSGSTAASGCGNNAPSFDLVVFFSPLPQTATGTAATGQSVSTTTPPATTTPSTTTPSTTTPATTTTPTSSSVPTSAQK
jgi:Tfp pilus assembly protein PilN